MPIGLGLAAYRSAGRGRWRGKRGQRVVIVVHGVRGLVIPVIILPSVFSFLFLTAVGNRKARRVGVDALAQLGVCLVGRVGEVGGRQGDHAGGIGRVVPE